VGKIHGVHESFSTRKDADQWQYWLGGSGAPPDGRILNQGSLSSFAPAGFHKKIIPWYFFIIFTVVVAIALG
jgi:hypothetical protein